MVSETQRAANRKRVARFYANRKQKLQELTVSHLTVQTVAAAIRNAAALGNAELSKVVDNDDIKTCQNFADSITPKRKSNVKTQKKTAEGSKASSAARRGDVRGIRVQDAQSSTAAKSAAQLPNLREKTV